MREREYCDNCFHEASEPQPSETHGETNPGISEKYNNPPDSYNPSNKQGAYQR